MLRLPEDPLALNDRLIAALCQDFTTPEFLRTGNTPRANAVVEVSRQTRSPRGPSVSPTSGSAISQETDNGNAS